MKKVEFWAVSAVILAIVVSTGCRTKEVIVEKWSERVVEVVKIDTVVVVDGGHISEVTPMSLLGHGIVHRIDHDLADIHITIDTLKNTLRTDIIVHDREVEIKAEKTTTTDRKFTREQSTKKPTRRVSWWVWVLIGAIIGAALTWRLK